MNLEELRKIERLYIHSRQQHYIIEQGLERGFVFKTEAFTVWKTYHIAAENMGRLCRLGIFKLDRDNSNLYHCLVDKDDTQLRLGRIDIDRIRVG